MNLAVQQASGGTPAPVGRVRLVGSIVSRLADGQAVAVHGPRGMGRTTVLHAVAETLPRPITVRLPRQGAAGHGARAVASAFPRDALEELPERMRSVLLDAAALPTSDPADRLGDALTELLTLEAGRAPFSLVIDDVQHLDGLSLSALRAAVARSIGPDTLGVLVAVGPGPVDPATGTIGGSSGSGDVPLLHIDLPPLTGADTVEMLTAEGMPMDTALWAHQESGGNPGLARELATVVDSVPTGQGRHLVQDLARTRVRELSETVRRTLRHVATMHQPSAEALGRIEGESAAASVRTAKALGLLVTEDAYLRLTPDALGDVLTESLDSDELISLHRNLAAHVDSEALARYHLALAGDVDTTPERLAAVATDCAATGEHDLAAQLYLLAADAGTEQRAEWLTRSLENAVIGKETRVLHRAARAAAELTDPNLTVRAKLALSELGEYGPNEVLVAALRESRDDPALQARVLLQRARILLVTNEMRTSLDLAQHAIVLSEKAGRPDIEVEALTVAASVSRSLGEDSARGLIEEAARLAGAPKPGQVHTSPRYIAARFALYADDLGRARSEFIDMLAGVGSDAGLDTVHVLRSLVEVVARQGRGREALELAGRATRAASHFDTPVATTWFIEAVAESVGGSFERAKVVATRGVQWSRQQDDERYLRRHLVYLGMAQLHLDELEGAVTSHRELRRMEAARGIRDVTSLRWHADAVTALALTGALAEAAAVLAELREVIDEGGGAPGVVIAADRAEAEVVAARGSLDEARRLAERSVSAATEQRLPIERARALVTLAHVERRARRSGRSREAAARAREVLRPLHADPWAAWVQGRFPEGAALHTLEPEEPETDPLGALSTLTSTEQQVAGLVAEGASNREIAQRLHLSVKTVEGTLTRAYRKLDIRSRTQLATLVLGRGGR